MAVVSDAGRMTLSAPGLDAAAKARLTQRARIHEATTAPASAARPDTDRYAGLAERIRRDGGLSLLRSRIEEKLGEVFDAAQGLDPDLAITGPGEFFAPSLDLSPEATADRIVGFALGMFGIHQAQNPQQSKDEMKAGFESEIRRGIEDGFASARRILSGLELFEGTVKAEVDETWELVMDKLDEAFAVSRESEET